MLDHLNGNFELFERTVEVPPLNQTVLVPPSKRGHPFTQETKTIEVPPLNQTFEIPPSNQTEKA